MADLQQLTTILWRQRQLVEQLLYRSEVQQLLLSSGRTRWTAASAHDVEVVIDRMRHEELQRALCVAAVAADLGLETRNPSLRELISVVPAPWDGVLRDHQEAFLALTSEIDQITRSNRELLTRGHQATRELLAALAGGPEASGYDADGGAARLAPAAHLVDHTI
jgi:hypothetical protein